jgi:PAS domain S-box-containing protein
MQDFLTLMADYKEKYDELLKSNRKLKEEIDFLRSKFAGWTDHDNNGNVEKSSRERVFLEHLIDSIPEAIAIINTDSKIVIINKEFTDLFGYTAEEATNVDIDSLILPDELKAESIGPDNIAAEKHKLTKQTIRRDKYGRRIQVSLIATNVLIDNEIVGSLGIYRDISLEKKSQTIQEILYNISTAALNQMDIKDIYPTIVNELSKIWDTSNFFIALYDKASDSLSMPFFSDEMT